MMKFELAAGKDGEKEAIIYQRSVTILYQWR